MTTRPHSPLRVLPLLAGWLVLGALQLAPPVAHAAPPAPPAVAFQDLRAAYRAADRAADAVVLLQYVLRKDEEGFGAVGQRVRLATVGVIVSSDGLVLLPGSVFPEDEEDSRAPARPDEFVARLRDGTRIPGTVVSWDRQRSLALLRLEPPAARDFPWITFPAQLDLEAGDAVLLTSLLPEKYGYQPSFTSSRIAAVLTNPRRAYDIDANVQETMVGGPVFDAAGRAVGVLATEPFGDSNPGPLAAPLKLIGSISRGKEPGFPVVVPQSEIAALLDSPPPIAVRTAGERAWLGVTLQPVGRALADYWQLQAPTGILVTSVWQGSPAEQAGLQPEDIIVSFGGAPVQALDDNAVLAFVERVRETAVGEQHPLRVLRDLKPLDLSVRLTPAPTTSVRANEYRNATFGLAAQDLTIDIIMGNSWPADQVGALVTDVETAGWSQVGGIQEGDLVLAVNGLSVANVSDLEAALEQGTTERVPEAVFFVLRDPDTMFVSVKTTFR